MGINSSVWARFERCCEQFRLNAQMKLKSRQPESEFAHIVRFEQGDLPLDPLRPTYAYSHSFLGPDMSSLRRYCELRDWPYAMREAALNAVTRRKNPHSQAERALVDAVEPLHAGLRQEALDALRQGPMADVVSQWGADELCSTLEMKLYVTPSGQEPLIDRKDPVVRFMPHADLTLITLLLQQQDAQISRGGFTTELEVSAGDLHAHSPAGWEGMRPIDGQAVVNSGEFARIATHGEAKNTIHRVVERHVVPSGYDRGSSTPSSDRVEGRLTAALFVQPPWHVAVRSLHHAVADQKLEGEYVSLLATAHESISIEPDDLGGDWMPIPS